jgi:hypothetical protein
MGDRSDSRRIAGGLLITTFLPVTGYLLDYRPVMAYPVDDLPSTIGGPIDYPGSGVSYSSNTIGTATADRPVFTIDW